MVSLVMPCGVGFQQFHDSSTPQMKRKRCHFLDSEGMAVVRTRKAWIIIPHMAQLDTIELFHTGHLLYIPLD